MTLVAQSVVRTVNALMPKSASWGHMVDAVKGVRTVRLHAPSPWTLRIQSVLDALKVYSWFLVYSPTIDVGLPLSFKQCSCHMA